MGAKKGKEQGLGNGKEQMGRQVPFQRTAYAYWGEAESLPSPLALGCSSGYHFVTGYF